MLPLNGKPLPSLGAAQPSRACALLFTSHRWYEVMQACNSPSKAFDADRMTIMFSLEGRVTCRCLLCSHLSSLTSCGTPSLQKAKTFHLHGLACIKHLS